TSRIGLSAVLDAAAVLCVVLGVAAFVPHWPRAATRHGWPLARAGAWLRQPAVAALAVLLFFQSGNEFLLGGYVSTLLSSELGLSPAGAAYAVAVFWAAIMASRLGMSWWLQRTNPAIVVIGGALGAS